MRGLGVLLEEIEASRPGEKPGRRGDEGSLSESFPRLRVGLARLVLSSERDASRGELVPRRLEDEESLEGVEGRLFSARPESIVSSMVRPCLEVFRE
jgi:hypothetical protein